MTENSLQLLTNAVPLGNLDAYIYRVNQIPMLSAEEEQSLAKRLIDQEDLAAARRLVMSHLRFVVKIARGYSGYGLAQADLIQEGNVGLMKAVKRFDPCVGVRLVSFAVHWIRAEIHDYIMRHWRIVKVATTKAQRKLFFNLRRFKQRLGWFTRDEVTDVAQTLGVTTQDVLEMESRLNARDVAFENNADDEDDNQFVPAAYLADANADPARALENLNWSESHQEKLVDALGALDQRGREIIEARWLQEDNKATLQDLATRYGVSVERIRQIESATLAKLKKALLVAA